MSKAGVLTVCGIAGAAWWKPEKKISQAVLQRMTDSIRHRGPDAEGHLIIDQSGDHRPGVALGHRRLSIIDVAGSVQPLGNEDGSVQIVFNGEIYNYRELREQLLAAGHQFRTNGDTEVIVHLYEEHGPDCVDYLRGMFAFAIWDSRKQQLVVARDRLGQKPFYYRMEEGRFAFASELKALLQIPGIPRVVDNASVLRYMMLQYVPAPHSILQGFNRLPPATVGILKEEQFSTRRFWFPPFDQPDYSRTSIADWKDELRQEMTEAVRLRLRSDVPLGAFLSGGIDSTVITGLMQEQLEQPVQTFSIGFSVKAFDERHYARQASEMLGTDHHEAVVEPDALSILPQLIWHYDEPFSDSSAIPTMYLSQMTRENVTVALTGDAGDELFCGYDRYRAVRMANRMDVIPGWARKMAAAAAAYLPGSVRQKSLLRRAKRLLETLGQNSEERYLNWISIYNRHRLRQVIGERLAGPLQNTDPAECIFDAYKMFSQRDLVTRTTAVDIETYLPGDLLTKVDIASMHVGLECRSPMLDHKVVELAARMPLAVKQNYRHGKLVLTETFRDLIPADIQTRKKMGFGVPIDHWFRNELKPMLHDVLLSEKCLSRGLLNPTAVRTLVEEHTSAKFDHAYRLWNLLCLELWHRRFIDQFPTL